MKDSPGRTSPAMDCPPVPPAKLPWPSPTLIPIASTHLSKPATVCRSTARKRIGASYRDWRMGSYGRTLGGRTHYYFRVVAAPDNENETYFLTAAFSTSIDGGETLRP